MTKKDHPTTGSTIIEHVEGKDLPKKWAKQIKDPLNTTFKVIIKREEQEQKKAKKPYLPFLDSDPWDDPNLPTDLSVNHDKYLYDEEL